MNITTESIVGEIVAHDFRTAEVFKSNRIDFCCRGNRSIAEVCQKNQMSTADLIEKLNASLKNTENGQIDFRSWDPDLLIDFIEKKHHRYVEKTIPILLGYLQKIAKVHGESHPELLQIESLFAASATDLLHHMQKEEQVLFPFIRQMLNEESQIQPFFGTVKNPISMMKEEHDQEGVRFREMAALSNDFNPPADACGTYTVAFAMLQEFESDLHQHIHLENNILFPKAIELEKSLNYA